MLAAQNAGLGAQATALTNAAAAGSSTAASTGFVGGVANAAKGAIGWMQANPELTIAAGKGVAGGIKSLAEDRAIKKAEEKDRERGFFGMNQVGTQVDLPTSGGLVGSVAAPTIQGQQTQTQVAQGGQDPNAAYLTPSQLLEMQRQRYIQNPYGTS
jgi:hypothetical protein